MQKGVELICDGVRYVTINRFPITLDGSQVKIPLEMEEHGSGIVRVGKVVGERLLMQVWIASGRVLFCIWWLNSRTLELSN